MGPGSRPILRCHTIFCRHFSLVQCSVLFFFPKVWSPTTSSNHVSHRLSPLRPDGCPQDAWRAKRSSCRACLSARRPVSSVLRPPCRRFGGFSLRPAGRPEVQPPGGIRRFRRRRRGQTEQADGRTSLRKDQGQTGTFGRLGSMFTPRPFVKEGG